MSHGFFIAGTDTGVGKTQVACALLASINQQGFRSVALKPVASGCVATAEGWRNDDALLLQQAANVSVSYQQVNPFAFAPAIAPHLAAAQMGQSLSVASLQQSIQSSVSLDADYIVVEGVGGWQVPLNATETMADFAVALGFPVILVVGLRLGCLNHALLTAQSLHHSGVRVAGWIANLLDADMLSVADNVNTLKERLPFPLLATAPFCVSGGLALDYAMPFPSL